MSIYDDFSYMTRYERENGQIQPCDKDKESEILNEYKEFYKEFKNVSVEDLKKMMFLNKENGEEEHFNFMNNGQKYYTKFYLNKCKLFAVASSREQRIDIILDYIKKYYGVITENNLQDILTEVFGLKEQYPTSDYRFLLVDNFKKYQINLDNEEDRQKFVSNFFTSAQTIKEKNPMIRRLTKEINKAPH